MKQNSLIGLAGVIAAASLAAGCVPALHYGSVPPEPEYTTKLTTTTVPVTTRSPFTTHRRKKHTISRDEIYGTYYVAGTAAKKTYRYDNDAGTTYTGGSGYYGTTVSGMTGNGTAFNTGTVYTAVSGSGVQGETTAQTKKWVLVTDELPPPDTAPQETPAPETPAPEPEPVETPAPEPEAPEPAAPEPAAPEPAAEPAEEPAPEPAAEPEAAAE